MTQRNNFLESTKYYFFYFLLARAAHVILFRLQKIENLTIIQYQQKKYNFAAYQIIKSCQFLLLKIWIL
jgi:hypothetical protein